MKFFLIVLASFLLVSCSSSPGALMKKKPISSYDSSQSALQTKSCIEKGFSEEYPHMRSSEVENGYQVMLLHTMDHGPLVLVDVQKKSEGTSAVNVYKSGMFYFSDALKNTISKCR